MLSPYTRRNFAYVATGCLVAAASGCNSPENAVRYVPTPQLQDAKLALKGYQILSMLIGPRVVTLPYPGMRILFVVIIASSLVAKLAVEYIDDELVVRRLEETITAEERASLEGARYVKFTCESGMEQNEYLAPTQYS